MAGNKDKQAGQGSDDDLLKKLVDALAKLTETPPEDTSQGDTGLDEKVGFYAHDLVFEQLDKVAEEIAEQIAKVTRGEAAVVVVADEQLIKDVGQYKTLVASFDFLIEGFESLLNETPREEEKQEAVRNLSFPGAITILPDVVSVLGNVAQLLSVERTFQGFELNIHEAATRSLVARIPRHFEDSQQDKIISLPILLTTTPREREPKRSNLLAKLVKLLTYSSQTSKNQSEGDEQNRELKALDQAVGMLLTELGLSGTDSSTSIGKFSQLLSIEHAANIVEAEHTYLLVLNVVALGGDRLTEKAFLRGSALYYMGGAIVTYFLLDQEGNTVHSDTVRRMSDYTKFELPE